MANANPSGPNYAVAAGKIGPERNHLKDATPIALPDGTVVLRKLMTNGNYEDIRVFAPDYPRPMTLAEWEAKHAPAKSKRQKDEDNG